MDCETLIKRHPARAPVARLIWTAVVDVGDRVGLGVSALGRRFMVPILGGKFRGAAGFEALSGIVLPGGADRQLLRADGVKELDAIYEMQAESGEIIQIRNRVIVDEARTPERYAMSVISASGRGPFAWLERRLLIGTLQSARPDREAVIIRAWESDIAQP